MCFFVCVCRNVIYIEISQIVADVDLDRSSIHRLKDLICAYQIICDIEFFLLMYQFLFLSCSTISIYRSTIIGGTYLTII